MVHFRSINLDFCTVILASPGLDSKDTSGCTSIPHRQHAWCHLSNTKIAIMFGSHRAAGQGRWSAPGTESLEGWLLFRCKNSQHGRRAIALEGQSGSPAACLRGSKAADHVLLRLARVRDTRQLPFSTTAPT